MSKKHHNKKRAAPRTPPEAERPSLIPVVTPLNFGTEEMLGELEAIIAEAEVRLAQEALQA